MTWFQRLDFFLHTSVLHWVYYVFLSLRQFIFANIYTQRLYGEFSLRWIMLIRWFINIPFLCVCMYIFFSSQMYEHCIKCCAAFHYLPDTESCNLLIATIVAIVYLWTFNMPTSWVLYITQIKSTLQLKEARSQIRHVKISSETSVTLRNILSIVKSGLVFPSDDWRTRT